MRYHMMAFFLGFCLDLIMGDPYCLPHPIRLIGNLISKLEKYLRKDERGTKNMWLGLAEVIIVLMTTVAVTAAILLGAYKFNVWFGMIVEMIMTYQILATKCLKVESMKVYKCLKSGDIEASRKAVSMIVGRDTQSLDEEGVAKAAIETVAENTSDGVIAPMLFTAIGGPIFGFFYKAVNTMDSMIGYKNDKYLYFGRTAAKLDDIVNFLPARISAYLMIVATFFAGLTSNKSTSEASSDVKTYSVKRAFYIYKRDNRNHASPNSAQTESVCAGALGIRLAGDACYFGKVVKKPYIGDAYRKVEYEDIRRINYLMYLTAFTCEAACLMIMFVLH